jgi:hypothetical protein
MLMKGMSWLTEDEWNAEFIRVRKDVKHFTVSNGIDASRVNLLKGL